DNSEKPGNGKRETGQVQGREQGEQIVSVLTQLGKPSPHLGKMAGVGVVVSPLADNPPAFDVAIRGLQASEQRSRIAGEKRRHEHWIARQRIDSFPLSRFP